MQIQWKIGFSIIPLWGIILLQNFCICRDLDNLDESRIKFPWNLNYDGQIVRKMGPRNDNRSTLITVEIMKDTPIPSQPSYRASFQSI